MHLILSNLFFALAALTWNCELKAADDHETNLLNAYGEISIIPITGERYLGRDIVDVYYTLACNEHFVEVLTQPESRSRVAVGVAVWRSDNQCGPNREFHDRHLISVPDNYRVHSVNSFKEVWSCSMYCIWGWGSEHRWIEALGTSEKQAAYNLRVSASRDHCENDLATEKPYCIQEEIH